MPHASLTVDEFSGEKLRGALSSVVSGATAGGLMMVGVNMGMSATASAAVFLYVFGSVFAYSLDIMFAKQKFPSAGTHGAPVVLPYAELAARGRYLVRSFFRKQFFRFIITVILDTLVGIALLKAAIRYMDDHDILKSFKYRDTIAAGLIAVFTFFLFTNILRFDWAYNDTENSVMNLIVLMWSTIVMMLFAITYVASDKQASARQVTVPVSNEFGHMLVKDLSQ